MRLRRFTEGGVSQRSSSQDASENLKKTASWLSNAKIILGAFIGAVATIFFAGMYYRDASETIKSYQNKIEQNAAELNAIRDQIAKMQNASGRITTRATDGAFAGDGSVGGYAGTYDLENQQFVQCPPGSFVSALQGFKPNGQSPIIQIRYSCRSLK